MTVHNHGIAASEPFTILDVPRINEEAKTLWLAALESGKYKQGQNALRTPSGNFCCLGVYCDATEVPKEVHSSAWAVPGTNPYNYIDVEMTLYGVGNNATQAIIPTDYEIPWADMEAANSSCGGWGKGFSGDENLFVARDPSQSDPVYTGTAWSLTKLNDTGFTFSQIADIIRYFL